MRKDSGKTHMIRNCRYCGSHRIYRYERYIECFSCGYIKAINNRTAEIDRSSLDKNRPEDGQQNQAEKYD